jgi:AraC family transcriptional regulator
MPDGMVARLFVAHAHIARELFCGIGRGHRGYVRQLRIEVACREITESGTPFLEIAAAAGFADQGHFARTFKRITAG